MFYICSHSFCGSKVQVQLSGALCLGPYEAAIMVFPELGSHLEALLGRDPLSPLLGLPAAFSVQQLENSQQPASSKPARKRQQDSRPSLLAGQSLTYHSIMMEVTSNTIAIFYQLEASCRSYPYPRSTDYTRL